MKKVLTILLVLSMATSMIFAAVSSTGTLEASTSDSAPTIKYTLDTSDADSVSTYKFGFAKVAVKELSVDVSSSLADDSYALKVLDTFVAELDSDVYVFWQIASPVGCTISLTPTDMTGDAGTLQVTVSSTNEGTPAGATTQTWALEDTKAAKTIVDYTPSSTNKNQAVGSQKIAITTANLSTLTATGSLEGSLTLTIAAKS